MLMLKVCGSLVSCPPLLVPPLSTARMVTVTLAPDDEGSGVYVSVPAPSTAGGVVNSPLSLGEIDTAKETVCPDSFGGPALPVVHPVTVCGPADAETFWSGP